MKFSAKQNLRCSSDFCWKVPDFVEHFTQVSLRTMLTNLTIKACNNFSLKLIIFLKFCKILMFTNTVFDKQKATFNV